MSARHYLYPGWLDDYSRAQAEQSAIQSHRAEQMARAERERAAPSQADADPIVSDADLKLIISYSTDEWQVEQARAELRRRWTA